MNPYTLARAQAYAAQVRQRYAPIVNRNRTVQVPEFLRKRWDEAAEAELSYMPQEREDATQ